MKKRSRFNGVALAGFMILTGACSGQSSVNVQTADNYEGEIGAENLPHELSSEESSATSHPTFVRPPAEPEITASAYYTPIIGGWQDKRVYKLSELETTRFTNQGEYIIEPLHPLPTQGELIGSFVEADWDSCIKPQSVYSADARAYVRLPYRPLTCLSDGVGAVYSASSIPENRVLQDLTSIGSLQCATNEVVELRCVSPSSPGNQPVAYHVQYQGATRKVIGCVAEGEDIFTTGPLREHAALKKMVPLGGSALAARCIDARYHQNFANPAYSLPQTTR